MAPIKNDIPSDFKHMFKETRNNISITSFLLKICDKLDVRTIFGLVCCSCERAINMITSDPLIEGIFDLKVVLDRQENECDYKERLTTISMMAQADGLSVDKEGMNSS